MPTPIWRGIVKSGRVTLESRRQFDAFAQSLEGKRVELVLRREVRRRGSAANRYFHGVVLKVLAEAWGWDSDDLKYELRRKFLQGEDHTKPPRHTSDLDSVEFARFVDDCLRLAAEGGVMIPDPRETEA